MQRPKHSHAHHPEVKQRQIGVCSNGIAFGGLSYDPTPFHHTPASKVVADLPDIGAGRVSAMLPFPDHRPSKEESHDRMRIVSIVPRFQYECSFIRAFTQQLVPSSLFMAFNWRSGDRGKPTSRSYSRLRGSGLFPTITTAANPECAYTGKILHWDEPRLISVQEARRAMGYPDEEVLVGNPQSQWKIIGNSVSRQVALALGLSLREAWLQSPDEGEKSPPQQDSAQFGVEIDGASNMQSLVRGMKRSPPSPDIEIIDRLPQRRRLFRAPTISASLNSVRPSAPLTPSTSNTDALGDELTVTSPLILHPGAARAGRNTHSTRSHHSSPLT